MKNTKPTRTQQLATIKETVTSREARLIEAFRKLAKDAQEPLYNFALSSAAIHEWENEKVVRARMHGKAIKAHS